jgi:hypothetical protein
MCVPDDNAHRCADKVALAGNKHTGYQSLGRQQEQVAVYRHVQGDGADSIRAQLKKAIDVSTGGYVQQVSQHP